MNIKIVLLIHFHHTFNLIPKYDTLYLIKSNPLLFNKDLYAAESVLDVSLKILSSY